MGSILENKIRYEKALDIMNDVAYITNDSLGVEAMTVDGLEGNEEDTTSLIISDVVSFTTLNPLAKEAFREALGYADAVNFFTRNDDRVRITMSFMDTCEPKKVETEVVEFKPKSKSKQ